MAHIRIRCNRYRAEVYREGVRKSGTFDTFDEARDWAASQEDLLSGRISRTLTLSPPPPTPSEVEFGELHEDGLIHSPESILRRPRFRPSPGIYFLIDGDEIVYVGRAVNVHARVAEHVRCWKPFDSYTYIPCPVDQLDALERYYILLLKPYLNVRGIAA